MSIYDTLNWKSANAETPTNTYTREAPDKVDQSGARDRHSLPSGSTSPSLPTTSRQEQRSPGESPRTQPRLQLRDPDHPTEKLSFDFNYAHDDVFSRDESVLHLCTHVNLSATARCCGIDRYLPADRQQSGRHAAHWPASSQLYLGNGHYDAPVNFFSGAISWAPSKYFRLTVVLVSLTPTAPQNCLTR